MDIGFGKCIVHNKGGRLLKVFNTALTLDNMIFEKPNKDLFNFNNPYGACENCNGHGDLIVDLALRADKNFF